MSKRSVLVVEDEPGLRRTLCRFLRQRGCAPEEAPDGVAALALIRERDFDAIVSDISMPNLDGVELWLRAAEERPVLKDRFLFASALPKPLRLQNEPVPFLRKPFELEQLWAALTMILTPAPASE